MNEGRLEVGGIVAEAERALAEGDAVRLAATYASLARWTDVHRAHQARCLITDRVLGHRTPGAGWVPMFVTALRLLLDSLDRDPAEPVLLNAAGVLAYELLQFSAAAALFGAALRLEPELPDADRNLAAAKARTGARVTPPGAFGSGLRTLSGRAVRIARRARPSTGGTLALCMIVRDEEEMLPGCLAPIHEWVDELIVADTGSTDRTVEIARKFGARVIEVPWTGSFAEARNISLDAAHSDWVMYLDADEHLEPADAPRLRELLGRSWREGFYLVETNYTGGEGSGAAMTHMALRVWRNRPEYRFTGRVHEQKTGSMPTYLPERFEHTSIRVRHYGYLQHRIRAREKSQRNIELLEREAREHPSPFNSFNLGSELLALGRYAEAARLFDRAWEEVQQDAGGTSAGYVPLLVARVARARRQSGDPLRALAATAEGLERFADHTDLVLEAALCRRELGELDTAAELAEQCLELGDAPARYAATAGAGTFLALSLLAQLRADAGEPDEAEALWRRSLETYPEYAAPVLPLVAALARREASDAEIDAVVPSSPTARLLAASALHEAGRAALAEQLFDQVLERQPQNAVAQVGLAECLIAQSRFAEAATAAASAAPGSVLKAAALESEMFALAVCRDAQRMRERLAACAPDAAPGCAELWRAWAEAIDGAPAPTLLSAETAAPAGRAFEALLKLRRTDDAALLLPLVEAAAIDPRSRREFLARVYLRRGFLESAADEWIAVMHDRPDVEALLGLAQVAVARGLPDDAAQFARAALDLEPGSVPARRLIAHLAA